jgi:hypothetical protein
MASGRVDDVILDRQVIEEELPRQVVVGLDAADFGSCQKDIFRTFAGKEGFDSLGVTEVDLPRTFSDEVSVATVLKTAPDGAPGQTVVARDVNLRIKGQRHAVRVVKLPEEATIWQWFKQPLPLKSGANRGAERAIQLCAVGYVSVRLGVRGALA